MLIIVFQFFVLFFILFSHICLTKLGQLQSFALGSKNRYLNFTSLFLIETLQLISIFFLLASVDSLTQFDSCISFSLER